MNKKIIIGAGPSGMGCSYVLGKSGHSSLVIDKNDAPGGLCRTIDFKGYLFDIGGHRFLSGLEEVNKIWHEIMDGEMLHVNRLSRIYYMGKYFDYPLSFQNALKNLGAKESFLCLSSYLKHRVIRLCDDHTFEGWIKNRFGERLYEIFFKDYTEKVWSTPCNEISSDWAKERIKNLSLKAAIKKALFNTRNNFPKTLCSSFLYPKHGAGEFYDRFKNSISKAGGTFYFGKTVIGLEHKHNKIVSVKVRDMNTNKEEDIPADYVFSSMALPAVIDRLTPKPQGHILKCAKKLRFRSLIVVNIVLDIKNIFSDNWIYIHSPDIKLSRIQNYKNWSPFMVKDATKTTLGLEYFCAEGDALWNMEDSALINLALEDMVRTGIAPRKSFVDGFVVRSENAYPLYTLDYKDNLCTINKYLERFENFQAIGRTGLFQYDNSDQALLTGIYAANKFLSRDV